MLQKILISQRFGVGGSIIATWKRGTHRSRKPRALPGSNNRGAPVDRVYIFTKIHSSILAGSYIKTRMPPSLTRFSVLLDVKTCKSQALPVWIWSIWLLGKTKQGVKPKRQQMTHLPALQRHISSAAMWPWLQPGWGREEPQLSVLVQQVHCSKREKKKL